MLSDALSLPDGTRLTADVCIVGAGAAGITLARELRNSGLEVLLLEAGGLDREPRTQALYAGTMSGISTWSLDVMRARQLGGSTNLWGGWCRPLAREDFAARSYIDTEGWPMSYDDLVPYYRRAHETVEIGGFDYDVVGIAEREGYTTLPFDGSIVENRMYQYSFTQFGTRYRADLEQAGDIDAYLHANLTGIVLGSAGAISHLECATLGGGRFIAEAQRYVLALGGIENARVLLATGVASGSGRVGRFMEHPHYLGTVVALWKGNPALDFYFDLHNANIPRDGKDWPTQIRGAIGLSAAIRAAENLPSFTATIESLNPRAPAPPTGALAPDVARVLFGRDSASTPTYLTFRAEQTATEESKITLSSEVDELGMPRVDLHWAIARADDERLQRSCDLLGQELGRYGMGRLWRPEPTWEAIPGGHHLGTTRMSVDPSRGVVDANLRTHEVDNLYIVGGSVFASGGDSNPTLTIVALAHRLADHLKGVA